MTAITRSFRLTEIVSHVSYPLNSANASPPGTFTAYLSCAKMARPPMTASHTVAIPIIHTLLRFIAVPPVAQHDIRRRETQQLDDGIGRYLGIGRGRRRL